jgi:hypothetical protein
MLYQLSYASPTTQKHCREYLKSAGTLRLRASHGTVPKVSTPAGVEQTRKKGRPSRLFIAIVAPQFGASDPQKERQFLAISWNKKTLASHPRPVHYVVHSNSFER